MNAVDARPLPPVAARVDAALASLDAEVDWLLALSPIGNERLWREFQRTRRTRVPELKYQDSGIDLESARKRLLALPVDKVESPLLAAILAEKQREIDLQIELVRMRGTEGFISASLELFGGVEATDLRLAKAILADIEAVPAPDPDTGVEQVLHEVKLELDWYRRETPDFQAKVVVDSDINSMMMVSHGVFYINGDIRIPRRRLQPLIQHEIGTHLVTRHNGGRQPLTQLQVGLADYDALQEGLGVLSEYIAGFLPGARLRLLAGRVVAVDMAVHGEGIPAIFECLHHQHGIGEEDAFDTAVRAHRGGGLTKDAVYLRGLRDLVDYLHEDGDFESLFAGKFALSHTVVLDQLREHGWVAAPALLPRYCSGADFASTLQRCRTLPVGNLFHEEVAV